MAEKSLWPDGNRCCVCLTFDLDAEWVFKGNFPETAQMPRKLSLGKYVWDADVVPRILDLLDTHRVRSTFFVVGMNAVNHPDVIKMIVDRGHEVACHGWQHENIQDSSKEEEKKRLLQTVEVIEKASGVRPVGNRTAGGELSPNTLDLLGENGFVYDSSLRNSDLPYFLEQSDSSPGKGLVIVPSYYDMDDFFLFANYPGTHYLGRMHSPETGYEIWTLAFDGYYKYGLCYTTMFHPQIIGKPGLLMLFDRLLSYIKKFPGVWFATAQEISRHWIETRK